MSDWHPQAARIDSVQKHPDADSLDIVEILGSPVVTKGGEYKVGDIAGYLPIDTIVPDTEQFYFLSPVTREMVEENGEVKSKITGRKFPLGQVPEKYRILKAKKIRGIYSQGMLVPISLAEGESLTDSLGLKKWEEPEEIELPKGSRGKQDSPPSGWTVPYYDIEGARKYAREFIEGEEVVATLKIHGANFAARFDGEKLWIKSRNYFKKDEVGDQWWDAARRLDLEGKLKAHPEFNDYIFFAEVYGQVKGFSYDTVTNGKCEPKLRFFDMFNVQTERWADYDFLVESCDKLGILRAPELYRGPWSSLEDLKVLAEGPDPLNPKHVREGFVVKPVKYRFSSRLQSRLLLKLVGEGYNLQK